MATIIADSIKVKLSGLTNVCFVAKKAPAKPPNIAPMAKAVKDKKKMKKESIDSKLAEIGKEAEAVKLEAQLNYLHDHIQEKLDRVSSIQEDENLSELIDKSKMKQMQREIKDLERRKVKMERIYEKSCGKSYQRTEMVDEVEIEETNSENE